jgi:hypothetical protein
MMTLRSVWEALELQQKEQLALMAEVIKRTGTKG